MLSSTVLGRDRETAILAAIVGAAGGAEEGATLLIVGEPGIGKSVLLAGVREQAQRKGYAALSAAGVETEMHLPFGGIHQLLSPLLGHLASLPRRQQDAIAAALGFGDAPRPDLFLIAEAAVALVRAERARRPVAVTVDDVHWLDPQSHQILAFLAHRAVSCGIAVIGTTRPGHPGPFADGGFPQMQVGGLDDETAASLLGAHAAALTAADRMRIRREARGNPLALIELPRSWTDESPNEELPVPVSDRLERAFAGRVSELPTATRDVLLVAAVGSSSAADEVARAAAVLGTTGPLRDLLAPAVAAGLLTAHGSDITFRHPLVRSSVLQRETLTRRRAAHAALASVISADRYRSTWHRAWSTVGPDDLVADLLAESADDSLRRGAVMSAVTNLERAAQLTSDPTRRGDRVIQAASWAFEAGRADVVARLLGEARTLDLADLAEIRATWLTEALNDDVRADPALLLHLCDSASSAMELGDDGIALNLLVAAALRCWWAESGAGDSAKVLRVLDGMGASARDDPRHLAAVAIAAPVARGAEVQSALGAVGLDGALDGDSLRVYGMAAYGVGDLVLATDLLDRAEDSFRRDGRLGMLPVVLALQLHIRLDLGDWSGADLAGQEVVTVSRETGQAVFADNHVLVEARGLALRGRWQSALDSMAGAEAAAGRQRINDRICLAYQARGIALLSARRPAEAFACLRRQYDPSDDGYHLRESFAGVAVMAEAAATCGRIDEARPIVDNLSAVAVITPSPLLHLNLLYAQAVLAPPELQEERFVDALAHDLSRWPWLRARLQLAYGQWLAGAGRCAAAVNNLQAAAAELERLGAVAWETSARRSLAELRTRPRPRGAPGPDSGAP